MKIITILTNSGEHGFNQFLKPSCEYFGLELIVLEAKGKYTGHRMKDALLSEFLQSIPENEIILFTDGHDTAFMAAENEILSKFNAFKSPIIFSAEINCWPTQKLEKKYPRTKHHFKYLNSGGFIGYASHLIDLYERNPIFSLDLKSDYSWSNQYFWHHVYLKNQDTIKLDHNCELFLNISTPLKLIRGIKFHADNPKVLKLLSKEKNRLHEEIDFFKGRITYKRLGTSPCHLHFPGPISKFLMNDNFFDSIKVWNLSLNTNRVLPKYQN